MSAAFRVLIFIFYLSISLAYSQDEKPDPAARWNFHFEELQIQSLQNSLSNKHKPENIAFVNANLITMRDDKIQADQTVLVENGKVTAIGSSKDISVPEIFKKVDCTGKYLMPGLVDMHVHNLVSSSQHLLNLANGVTSVRDMDGFPWMLKMRDQIASNKLLAPNMYVAGHILNQRPLGMYATVVTSPEEARKVVREQKAAGYDFIKIHNSMDLEIYSAILDEAKKQNLDAVGHIPHFITVKQAVEHGQKTFEHFKGYILDRGLVLTKEDYVQSSRSIHSWNCPTFYTYREHLRGDEARKLINESREMKYVSWRDKNDWLELAKKDPDRLQQNILPLSIKIFKDLIPTYDKFIAGTDSGGGYPFMVPGFALHEELNIMNNNGLSPYETLKTATVNAAQAINREKEFGTIEIGKRADLLLLSTNPLNELSNLSGIEGVTVRGTLLSRKDLDEILGEIEKIYNPAKEKQNIQNPSPEQIAAFLKSIDALKAKGFVFRSHDVDEIAELRNSSLQANVNTNVTP
jgi:imidazolonepropionase-like amidohydrolase